MSPSLRDRMNATPGQRKLKTVQDEKLNRMAANVALRNTQDTCGGCRLQ